MNNKLSQINIEWKLLQTTTVCLRCWKIDFLVSQRFSTILRASVDAEDGRVTNGLQGDTICKIPTSSKILMGLVE